MKKLIFTILTGLVLANFPLFGQVVNIGNWTNSGNDTYSPDYDLQIENHRIICNTYPYLINGIQYNQKVFTNSPSIDYSIIGVNGNFSYDIRGDLFNNELGYVGVIGGAYSNDMETPETDYINIGVYGTAKQVKHEISGAPLNRVAAGGYFTAETNVSNPDDNLFYQGKLFGVYAKSISETGHAFMSPSNPGEIYGVYGESVGEFDHQIGYGGYFLSRGASNGYGVYTEGPIGIYAEGTGFDNTAGKFKGNIEVSNSADIQDQLFVGKPGNQWIFHSQTWTTNPDFLVIAPEDPSHPDGWNWDKGLTLWNKAGCDYTATVAGKFGANEIEVQVGSWCDYVFEDDYELAPLEEVEKFINQNKHLPGIPSEKEVKENGLNLGEMDAALLKKVEELTLYMIQLKEENKELKARIELLENVKK